MTKIEEPEPEEMGTWVNQRRDEPLPASHDDEHGQAAVSRNEEHAETHAGKHADGRPGPVRLVSNAVPGKPDGEVDTRP